MRTRIQTAAALPHRDHAIDQYDPGLAITGRAGMGLRRPHKKAPAVRKTFRAPLAAAVSFGAIVVARVTPPVRLLDSSWQPRL